MSSLRALAAALCLSLLSVALGNLDGVSSRFQGEYTSCLTTLPDPPGLLHFRVFLFTNSLTLNYNLLYKSRSLNL